MFRRSYKFQRKEVLRLLSDRGERPIPVRHIEVRILPPQPGSLEAKDIYPEARKKPAIGGLLQFRAGL
jgi:hypothetical protein